MGASRIPRSVVAPALSAVARGVPRREAAALAGISMNTLQRRITEEAVVVLRHRTPRAGALRLVEREEIRVGIDRGESDAQIARRLGKHRSTIWREIDGHGGRDRYRAYRAQDQADGRAERPKESWTIARAWLWVEVQALLRRKIWSPEQIAGRLRRDHPDEPEWWVSHEAIYHAIFVQARGTLRTELAACLRSGRARRRPQGRVSGGSKIVGRACQVVCVSGLDHGLVRGVGGCARGRRGRAVRGPVSSSW
jgi:IS30 family transposase